MSYTGLEFKPDCEVIRLADLSDQPIVRELANRFFDLLNDSDVEGMRERLKDATERANNLEAQVNLKDKELARRASQDKHIKECDTQLRLANDRANDFENKARRLQHERDEEKDALREEVSQLNGRIKQLESEARDRPATEATW